MKLPTALLGAVRNTMGNHGDWHLARRPRRWIPVEDRPKWSQAREHYLNPKFVTEKGSGREFLEFHRMMVRHFRWLIENTPGHNYVFIPWTDVPDWLRAGPDNPRGFSDEYLAEQNTKTSNLINNNSASTADQLGSFLESTDVYDSSGLNFHNHSHGLIAGYEYKAGSGYEGAEMDDFATAHYNEHFWNLHGLLDETYASWQRAHGETPDQSPLDPGVHH